MLSSTSAIVSKEEEPLPLEVNEIKTMCKTWVWRGTQATLAQNYTVYAIDLLVLVLLTSQKALELCRKPCRVIAAADPSQISIQGLVLLNCAGEKIWKNICCSVYGNKESVDEDLVDIIRTPADADGALDAFVSIVTGPPGPNPYKVDPKTYIAYPSFMGPDLVHEKLLPWLSHLPVVENVVT
ncbi:hypothetical protein HAX54_015210 [Datura stramonium]|uniref:Uncharacterized protein n=1 Tax=Datura stramonium TaxID=4076 RepID=A0ABS8TQ95_DATST|nr:hypothetical protein [Datura stramonium]